MDCPYCKVPLEKLPEPRTFRPLGWKVLRPVKFEWECLSCHVLFPKNFEIER